MDTASDPVALPEIGQRFPLEWRHGVVATVMSLPYGTGVELMTDDGIPVSICGNDWRDWMKGVKPVGDPSPAC